MARFQYTGVVQDTAGNCMSGIPVTVAIHGGGAASIYAGEVGGSPLASLSSDITGTFTFWADNTASYDITPTGFPTRVVPGSIPGVGGPPSGAAGGDVGGTYPTSLTIVKDAVAGTASMRTLGTGAQQAMAGNTPVVVASEHQSTNVSSSDTTPTGNVSVYSQISAAAADLFLFSEHPEGDVHIALAAPPVTTLSAAINSSVTTVPLTAIVPSPITAHFQHFSGALGVVTIDSEMIQFTGITGGPGAGSLTGCTRGYGGSTPAAHSSGATVTQSVNGQVYVDAELNVTASPTTLAISFQRDGTVVWPGGAHLWEVAPTILRTSGRLDAIGGLLADTMAGLTGNDLTFTATHLRVAGVGYGLKVAEGTNGKQGVATLVAGTKTVNTTQITTASRVLLTAQDNNTTGALRVSARVASASPPGTSFTITSSNPADTGVVAYQIFEPA